MFSKIGAGSGEGSASGEGDGLGEGEGLGDGPGEGFGETIGFEDSSRSFTSRLKDFWYVNPLESSVLYERCKMIYSHNQVKF